MIVQTFSKGKVVGDLSFPFSSVSRGGAGWRYSRHGIECCIMHARRALDSIRTRRKISAMLPSVLCRKILPFLFISFHPHLSSLKRGLLRQAIPCRKVLNNLDILFNKGFQGQSLSNFKLYDDERQGQRVHEMVCFNRTKCNRCKVTMVMMVTKMIEMMMTVVVVVLRDKCISGLCFNWD